MEIAVGLLLTWLSGGLVQPGPEPVLLIGVLAAGAAAAVLGWASTRAVLTTTAWSLDSYRSAQRSLEEARDHRGQLAQALKELDAAYVRLERLNQMLNQARAEAEETRDARNRFSLAISHELRTPLNFIIGFSEIMMKTPDTYAPLRRWPPGLYDDIQEIYKSCRHLMHLVNDVLDLGQIENLRMDLIKEWIGMAQIVDEVQGMVQRGFDLKGIVLRTELEPHLPPVYVDRTRIRQVILNLANNSLRYTDQGITTIRVTTQPGELLIAVADTGTGIAEADIPRVFEEFQQVNKDSWRRREGAGLGIPISKRFVELHGGRMWVESTLGQGTTFYFTLPLATGTTSAARTVMWHSGDAEYWRALSGNPPDVKSVLVVSTDPAASEVLAPYVEGCTLTTANAPDEIAAQVSERLPVAILVDSAALPPDWPLQLELLPYDLPVISFYFPGSTASNKDLPACVRQRLLKPFSNQALLEALERLGSQPHKLLVVSEDPAMVNLVARVLASAGDSHVRPRYELVSAADDVVSHAAQAMDSIDGVILDISTRDIATSPTLQAAHAHGIPVLLLTAFDGSELSSGGSRQALMLQMRRPLSRQELTGVLKVLLEKMHPSIPEESLRTFNHGHAIRASATLPAPAAAAASPTGDRDQSAS
jgi:signal transduction histidine kinase/CheY-like chemotaxis protein